MLYPDFNELVELKARVASHKINSGRLMKSLISGNHDSPFKGQGLEFEEVRQYVAGDDIRKIDWRVTARSGKPHIKLFREEKERKILICHDLSSTMRFGTRSTFKSIQAAKISALLGWCALASNNMVGGCLFGDIEHGKKLHKPSSNHNAFLRMLQHICKIPVDNSASAEAVTLADTIDYLKRIAKSNMLIFIISDFLEIDDHLADNIAKLAMKAQLILISVNDPADFRLENCGMISVSATSNLQHQVKIDTSDELARNKYHQLAMDNAKKLENIAISNNIIHIPLLTNSDIYFELFSGVNKKASRKRGAR